MAGLGIPRLPRVLVVAWLVCACGGQPEPTLDRDNFEPIHHETYGAERPAEGELGPTERPAQPASEASADRAQAEPEAVELRFDWPASLQGRATYTTREESGMQSESLRVDAAVAVSGQGEQRIVCEGPSRVLETDLPADDPKLQLLHALARLRVCLEVGPGGVVAGTRGVDKMATAARAALPELPDSTPTWLRKLTGAVVSDAAMEAELVARWNEGTAELHGKTFALGRDYRFHVDAPLYFLSGRPVRLEVTQRVTGRLPCPGRGAQCVQLVSRMRLNENTGRRALLGFMDQLLGQVSAEREVSHFTLKVDSELTVEPDTLLPHRLKRSEYLDVAARIDGQLFSQARSVERETTYEYAGE